MLVASAVSPLAQSASAAASVRISPTSGPPGTRITITGSGYNYDPRGGGYHLFMVMWDDPIREIDEGFGNIAPDGTISYQVTLPTDTRPGKHELSLMGVHGAATFATLSFQVVAPTFDDPRLAAPLPSGDRIAYSSTDGAIWTMRPDGSDKRALTRAVTGQTFGSPSWSSDRASLVFVGYTKKSSGVNYPQAIFIYRDGAIARLPSVHDCDNPAFAPDDERLFFTCSGWGDERLYPVPPRHVWLDDPSYGAISSSRLDGSDWRVVVPYEFSASAPDMYDYQVGRLTVVASFQLLADGSILTNWMTSHGSPGLEVRSSSDGHLIRGLNLGNDVFERTSIRVSPDGKSLIASRCSGCAVMSTDPPSNAVVHLSIDLLDGQPPTDELLVDLGGTISPSTPSWGPDGQVVFGVDSSFEAPGDIYVVGPSSKQVVAKGRSPAWRPAARPAIPPITGAQPTEPQLVFEDRDAAWSDDEKTIVSSVYWDLPPLFRQTHALRGFRRVHDASSVGIAWWNPDDRYVYVSDQAVSWDTQTCLKLGLFWWAGATPSEECAFYTLEYNVTHEMAHPASVTDPRTLSLNTSDISSTWLPQFGREMGYDLGDLSLGGVESTTCTPAPFKCGQPTVYAEKDLAEDFAESVALYKLHPDYLGTDSKRYMFLRDHVFAAQPDDPVALVTPR